jgi:membrane-bound lytic murein transglycosylase D
MHLIHRFSFLLFVIFFVNGCTSLPTNKTDIPEEPIVLEPIEPEPEIVLVAEPENLWAEIVEGYGLPEISDQKIDKNLRWLAKHPNYMNKVTKQGEPFLFYIAQQMRENEIPMELTLIPIVESAFNPFVQSRSKALGLWQFVPRTGHHFGLKQNPLYDSRRDVIASTDAAVRYLKHLNKLFDGDWLLTMAAYNAGEGTVKRAMAKNKKQGKPTDFWSLSLSKQTQHYVPQIIALSKVVADPIKYNLNLNAIPNDPYFTKVNISKTIDMAQAAKMANINPDIMRQLNAGHTKWITTQNGPQELLVPIRNLEAFNNILPNLPVATIPAHELKALMSATTYVVKSGDSLWTIARKHKTSVKNIQQLNNLTAKSIIKPGQKLKVSTP